MEQFFLSLSKSDFQDLLSETINACLRRSAPISPPPPKPDEYFSRQQVKQRFHVSYPTLNSYTKTGKIIGYRIGRRVLYKKSEIEAALKPIHTQKEAGKS